MDCAFSDILREGERLDNIGFGDLKLIQKPDEFCYGVDAVILADFAARGGMRWEEGNKNGPGGYRGRLSVCDLGTGTGIIPFILSHKLPQAEVIAGLEVQKDSAERAIRGAALNGLSDKVRIVHGDVSDNDSLARLKEEAETEGFDIVVTNPPYFEGGSGLTGKNEAKYIARSETTGKLEDFIKAAAYLLKEKGDFYMVHRPSRLADICWICRKYRIEPKAMRFVSPTLSDEPNILLFHGVLGGGRELRVRKPLAVYDENGNYSQEINIIYER